MKLTEKELIDLREQLSSLEHDQWIYWSKGIANVVDIDISSEVRNRWKKYWIPYEDLSEDEKETDRQFADEVIELLKLKGILEIIQLDEEK